jgi:hypothetical protein
MITHSFLPDLSGGWWPASPVMVHFFGRPGFEGGFASGWVVNAIQQMPRACWGQPTGPEAGGTNTDHLGTPDRPHPAGGYLGGIGPAGTRREATPHSSKGSQGGGRGPPGAAFSPSHPHVRSQGRLGGHVPDSPAGIGTARQVEGVIREDPASLAVAEVSGEIPNRFYRIRHLYQWARGTSYPGRPLADPGGGQFAVGPAGREAGRGRGRGPTGPGGHHHPVPAAPARLTRLERGTASGRPPKPAPIKPLCGG